MWPNQADLVASVKHPELDIRSHSLHMCKYVKTSIVHMYVSRQMYTKHIASLIQHFDVV